MVNVSISKASTAIYLIVKEKRLQLISLPSNNVNTHTQRVKERNSKRTSERGIYLVLVCITTGGVSPLATYIHTYIEEGWVGETERIYLLNCVDIHTYIEKCKRYTSLNSKRTLVLDTQMYICNI